VEAIVGVEVAVVAAASAATTVGEGEEGYIVSLAVVNIITDDRVVIVCRLAAAPAVEAATTAARQGISCGGWCGGR
jgi:hypothetical protein